MAVVLRTIVIMPAIPPVIALTVSVSSPRFTAVKTASFLYFSASPFPSGSAPFLAPFFGSYISMLNFEIFDFLFYFFCFFYFFLCSKNVQQKAAGFAGCGKTFSLCCIIYSLFFFSITYNAKLFQFLIKVFFNTFICVICIFNSNQFIAMLFGVVAFSFIVFFLFF